MTGYDFDGVVTTGRFHVYPDDIIITGNVFHQKVMEYLSENKILARVYFQPDVRLAHSDIGAAVWKSEMIRRIGITEFYENSKVQRDIIKASCPDCEVIAV